MDPRFKREKEKLGCPSSVRRDKTSLLSAASLTLPLQAVWGVEVGKGLALFPALPMGEASLEMKGWRVPANREEPEASHSPGGSGGPLFGQ